MDAADADHHDRRVRVLVTGGTEYIGSGEIAARTREIVPDAQVAGDASL
jgi:hypothetical protein